MKLAAVKNGTSLIVTPEGRIDSGNVQDFEKQLKEAMDGVTTLVLDLSALEYISSAGLRVLIATQKELEAADGSMTLLQVNPGVKEILDITGLSDFLTIL